MNECQITPGRIGIIEDKYLAEVPKKLRISHAGERQKARKKSVICIAVYKITS